MNKKDEPTRRDPHPELQSPSTDLDLEAKISLAEQAVIARDERIRRRGALIVHRVQDSVLKHAGAGVAAVAGGLLLTWLLGRRGGGRPARPEPAEGLAREAGFSLAGLLPLVWPLIPRKVRRGVTPGMASTMLALVTPVLSWALGRRRRPSRS
jgi:hypothetical protein